MSFQRNAGTGRGRVHDERVTRVSSRVCPACNTVGSLDPTATQNTQARRARNAEGRRNCNTASGQVTSRRGCEKGVTTSGHIGSPEKVVPLSKARRTAGVPSGRFCVLL